MQDIKFYVRGNISFPTGVLNRLILLGGNVHHPFTEAELANPTNIFYIDFYNDNLIRKVTDDSVTGMIMKEHWTEVQPVTYIDSPESLPSTWDQAYEECTEVQSYIKGLNSKLDSALDKLGRCIVLRDIYRQGWLPKKDEFCYYLEYNLLTEELEIVRGIKYSKVLSFQDNDLAELYL